MFGLGTTELMVIGGIVFLLFGAKRLPQLGRGMGSAITNFKKGLKEGTTDENDKIENQSNENNENKES
jgi:sec-independent protein translocase protein TatA